MNSTILFATDFPHGTPDGYAKGCKGAHCPTSDAPCRDVYARFQGDYSFRKRVHAGENPADIIREELAAAEAVRVAEKEAERRARVKVRRKPAPKRPRQKSTQPRSNAYVHKVVALHAEGLTDREIATRLGLQRYQVAASRRYKNLAPNSRRNTGPSIPEQVQALYDQGMRDIEIAELLNRHPRHVANIRKNLGLPRLFDPHFDSGPLVIEAWESGRTVEQIADQFGFQTRSVQRTIRRHREAVTA